MDDNPAAGPIDLPVPLPEAALCDSQVALLEAELSGTPVLWWHGGDLTGEAAPIRWPARLGGATARPTDPNAGNSRTGSTGPETGLLLRDATHCGFVAPEVTKDAATSCLALRWQSPPGRDARTLLTLNMGGAARRKDGENYLFLSEVDGVLACKDDAGRAEVSLPCPAGPKPHLAVITLSDATLTLDLDGAHAAAIASAPLLHGPASLFLGARNHRPKLLKTLGDAVILDVWLWPERDRLDARTTNALRRYHLWSGP